VLLNLEKKLLPNQSPADAREALQSTIDLLETWFQQLQSSKPSL
jgi:hypothetical protein